MNNEKFMKPGKWCATFDENGNVITFEEDRQNALTAGMDEHLAKPIDIQRAFRIIAKFLK